MMCTKPLPHCISGQIVKGFGRGSKALGIPTANISEDGFVDLPKEFDAGIYYGWASIDGQIYKMVTSIGWNPFYNNEKKSVEVHILHEFENDFYGKELKIMITGYIRPEKNFNSVDDLIKEIKNDIAIAAKELDDERMIRMKNNTFLSGSCCE